MFAKLVLTDEEKAVDEELGYPHGYAKLCRHAAAQLQGLLTPFTEGPPQRFLPYAPQTEDVSSFSYQTNTKQTDTHQNWRCIHSWLWHALLLFLLL